MDNMLYIIAGLVLILLVAVLVLRKKKAQETSIPPAIQSGKKAATLTPTAKTNDNTPAHSREDIDKKFDHITIAQRFIDQQRHDKAIETSPDPKYCTQDLQMTKNRNSDNQEFQSTVD